MEAFVNGIKLHYVDEGTGFPLIVLHGLGLDVHSMEHAIHSFSTDFRVIAIDARGHGLSDKPAEYRLSDHVRDVIAVMDFLKLDKVYLVGGSMGSYIAQGVAIAAPERVKKLVLVTTQVQRQDLVDGPFIQRACRGTGRYGYPGKGAAFKPVHVSQSLIGRSVDAACSRGWNKLDGGAERRFQPGA